MARPQTSRVTTSPRRRTLVLAVAAGIASSALRAQPKGDRPAPPQELAQDLSGARLQGQARFRYFGFSVYDARLWTSSALNADSWQKQRLALELQYQRSLVGRQIAERSIEEIRRQPGVDDERAARWLAALLPVFPDVIEGDRITGLHLPGEAIKFYFNTRPVAEVRDAELAQRFMAIWLGPTTSEPALRAALLGLARP